MVKIASNQASLKAQRSLADTTQKLSAVYERLSSGMRINRASDDAAGLALSESLNSRSKLFTQAVRNVNDAQSALNIFEGALNELSQIVTRQKELAEQAANGAYSIVQRRALNTEANALVAEYNRIVQSTEFNEINFFTQTNKNLNVQAGIDASASVAFEIADEISRLAGTGAFTATGTYVNTVTTALGMVLADFGSDGTDEVVITSGVSIREYKDGVLTYSKNLTNIATDVEAGDFNGDGHTDLMASSMDGMILFTGNGSGTLNGVSTTAFHIGNTGDLAVGDFNNDGIDDIFARLGTTGRIYISDGAGGFNLASTFSSSLSTIAASVGDFDGDGNLDLLASTATSDPTIFYGLGDGTMSSSTVLTTTNAISVAAADLNGDGITDIVTKNLSGSNINLYMANGGGSFNESVMATSFGSGRAYLEDLNNDGLYDLIATGAGTGGVALGNGDGTFASFISFTSSSSSPTVFGDTDGDGVKELFYAGVSAVSKTTQTSAAVSTQAYLNITTRNGALKALDQLEEDLNRISLERGITGAYQSRLESSARHLLNSALNEGEAASRIRDADIASDTSEMVRLQILQQSASAVLTQANLQPELALKLLTDIRS